MRPDYRLEHALIVTMNPASEVIADGFIEISGSLISAIGPMNEVHHRPEPVDVMNLQGRLVMPGLVNCHTHAAMTLFRGMADDLPLDRWLSDYIWPAEARFVTAENVYLGTQLAIAEMFRSGTTLFADMYFFEEEVARACCEAGIRVLAGEAVVDFPSPDHATPAEAIGTIERLAQKYKHHPLVNIVFAPHSIYACSRATLEQIATESERLGIGVHIHLAETRGETENCEIGNGQPVVPYLASTGLLNNRLIAAHMIHVSEEETELAVSHGVKIALNPSSNMKLASGWAPMKRYLEQGIITGLGTDGAASNNNLDIFTEMRLTALVNKLITGDPAVMPAHQVVEMATIGGARVLGMDHLTGSLETGKNADMLIAQLNQPHLTPSYNIWSHIVYAMHSSDVESLFVDGRLVMHHREILTLDVTSIINQANLVRHQIEALVTVGPQALTQY